MADPVAVLHRRLIAAELRVVELETENALLKRALAMLTRSLEDTEASCPRPAE